MERRAARGPGARNRMRPAFALRALCEFSAPGLAPPRSVHASGLKLRSLPPGPGAPTNLRTPARLTRFDLFQTSRPATGKASRNAPDPGVYTRQSRSTGPRRRFGAWVPRRLSCDGDGERFARPRAAAGKSGREAVEVLKGLGTSGAAMMAEGFDPTRRPFSGWEMVARERRMRGGGVCRRQPWQGPCDGSRRRQGATLTPNPLSGSALPYGFHRERGLR